MGFLAFAELEALAGTGLAVLLAFAHTRIAGQHLVRLEERAERGVTGEQGPGDPVAASSGLAVRTAAGDADLDVVLAGRGGGREGLGHREAQRLDREVNFERAVVDEDVAIARDDADAGNGGLSATGSEELDGLRHVQQVGKTWINQRRSTR